MSFSDILAMEPSLAWSNTHNVGIDSYHNAEILALLSCSFDVYNIVSSEARLLYAAACRDARSRISLCYPRYSYVFVSSLH